MRRARPLLESLFAISIGLIVGLSCSPSGMIP